MDVYFCYLVPSSSSQDTFIEWTFGQRFKEDCLVLDSFVALPLVAKVSMAAVPGKGHIFAGEQDIAGSKCEPAREGCPILRQIYA